MDSIPVIDEHVYILSTFPDEDGFNGFMKNKTIKKVLMTEEYQVKGSEKSENMLCRGGLTLVFTDGTFIILGYNDLGEWPEVAGKSISLKPKNKFKDKPI